MRAVFFLVYFLIAALALFPLFTLGLRPVVAPQLLAVLVDSSTLNACFGRP